MDVIGITIDVLNIAIGILDSALYLAVICLSIK